MVADPLGGRLIMFGGMNGPGCDDIWELRPDAEWIWRPLATLGDGPPAAAGQGAIYDPEQRRLVVFEADGTPGPRLESAQPGIIAVQWSPNGQWIAVVSQGRDHNIQLWRADGTAGPVLDGNRNGTYCIAWSPDGRWLAYTPHSRDTRTWKRYRGGRAPEIWLFGLEPRVRQLAALAVARGRGCPRVVALHQLIGQAAGLTEAEVSNERAGLIAGSGGPSTSNFFTAFDTLINKSSPKRMGAFMVTRCMSSTVSACLATPFKIKGVNYSISSACSTSAHCIGNGTELIQFGKQDIIFAILKRHAMRFVIAVQDRFFDDPDVHCIPHVKLTPVAQANNKWCAIAA